MAVRELVAFQFGLAADDDVGKDHAIGASQKTSTTPEEWETAATPLPGSAEPGWAQRC